MMKIIVISLSICYASYTLEKPLQLFNLKNPNLERTAYTGGVESTTSLWFLDGAEGGIGDPLGKKLKIRSSNTNPVLYVTR